MHKCKLNYYKIIQSFIFWEYCNEIKERIISKWMGRAQLTVHTVSHLFAKSVSCRSAKFTTGDFECMVRLKKFTLKKLSCLWDSNPESSATWSSRLRHYDGTKILCAAQRVYLLTGTGSSPILYHQERCGLNRDL